MRPLSPILYSAACMRTLDSITPIILAAGDSTRMGYAKALLPIGSDTFLTRILKVLRKIGLAKPEVILGRAAAAIRPTVRDHAARILINPHPDSGQLSSIQIGLSNLEENTEACLIWPVDLPAVPENLVRGLAQLFLESECLMAFPQMGNKRGHPAIFHRSLFPEFMAAPLELGPKEIILRHLQDMAALPTSESAVIHDIDTPADYEALTGESIDTALARQNARIL